MNARMIRAAAIASHRYLNPDVVCYNRWQSAKNVRSKDFWFAVARTLAPVRGCPTDFEISQRSAIYAMRIRLYGAA